MLLAEIGSDMMRVSDSNENRQSLRLEVAVVVHSPGCTTHHQDCHQLRAVECALRRIVLIPLQVNRED